MIQNSELQRVRARIRQVLDQTGMSVNRLAGGNPALQRKLQRQINEDSMLTLDTVIYVLDTFGDLSADWLLSGRGEATRPAESGEDDICVDPGSVHLIGNRRGERTEDMLTVPIYSVEASANLDTLMTGTDLSNIIGTLQIPGIPHIDGATHVRGDSMYPVLHSGDLIGFKMLRVSFDSIFYGEMYLMSIDIEGDSYVTVKYLQPSELGREYVKLVSSNPAHPPKDIHLSTVRAMAMVKVMVHVL